MAMLGGIMSIVGGFVQAKGEKEKAEAEAKSHEYNAAVDVRNREIIYQQTGAAITDQNLENLRQRHTIRAKYAANGVTMTGSASDVLADTAVEQGLTSRYIHYKGMLAEIETTDDMNLQLMAADNARKAGEISATAAILGGLASGLSSFGSMMGSMG